MRGLNLAPGRCRQLTVEIVAADEAPRWPAVLLLTRALASVRVHPHHCSHRPDVGGLVADAVLRIKVGNRFCEGWPNGGYGIPEAAICACPAAIRW